MANRNLERLNKLEKALPSVYVGTRKGKGSGFGNLIERETTIAKLASGKQRDVRLYLVPPSRVRMWKDHNRRYDLLNESRCADLLESFTRTGKQEFAVIVRKVTDEEGIDFELVCGARRHWTANHLGWDLLVEVRELTDRQAFTLQDVENRDREDISDYERATDYRQALGKYFNSNQAQMAQFLEVDRSNFKKFLDLADLPKAIVNAYGDLRDLKVHHAMVYRTLFREEGTKRRILERAKVIRGDGLKGAQVLAELKRVSRAPDERRKGANDREVYTAPDSDKPILEVRRRKTGRIEVVFDSTMEEISAVRSAISCLLEDIEAGRW